MSYTTYRTPATIFEDLELLNKRPLRIFLALGRFFNAKNLIVFPKRTDIQNLVNIDKSNVRRSFRELENLGFIITDTFNNLEKYPITLEGYFKSNGLFYILPDYLIMEIENDLNKNIVNKEAFLLLKYSIDHIRARFSEGAKSASLRGLKRPTKEVKDASVKGPISSVKGSKHILTLYNYYTELLNNKLSLSEKLDSKTNQIIYNITIKDSFNSESVKKPKKEEISNTTSPRWENPAPTRQFTPQTDHYSLPSSLLSEVLKIFENDFLKAKEHLMSQGYTEYQVMEAKHKAQR